MSAAKRARTSAGPRAAGSGQDEAATAPESALVFVVPMPPTLTNSGKGRSRHWRAVKAERDAYCDLLSIVASPVGRAAARIVVNGDVVAWAIPPAPPAPVGTAWLTSDMVLAGAMDDDNAVARHKWLLDWLVTRGYLASDRRTCVRWAAFPTQRVTRKEPPRITLTLSPREAA